MTRAASRLRRARSSQDAPSACAPWTRSMCPWLAVARPQPPRYSSASAFLLSWFLSGDPGERGRADLLDKRVRRGEPPVPGAQGGVHRKPEALLGPLGRLVHIAARHIPDDEDVNVVRR